MGKVAQNITLERVAEAVEAIAINGAGSGGNAKDWGSIRNLVRAGMGPKAYPVGTQLMVEKENSMTATMGTHTGITAVSVTEETFLAKVGIVGTGVHEFKFDGAVWIYQEEAVNITEYGIAVTGTPAAGDEVVITESYSKIVFEVAGYKTVNGKPRMVLVMRDVIYNKPADETEALYVAPEGLAAGAYCFTVKNQPWYASDNDVTFYFTLTDAVPAGGQLVLSATYNATLAGKSIKTYSGPTSTSVIETVTLSTTEIENATSLGDTVAGGNWNHWHRAFFGSNNYKEGAIRQWINSKKAGGSWWGSTNKFDRPSSYASTAGLLHGMDADFLECVVASVVPCKTNNTFELDGWTLNTAYTVEDKFYLLSRNEVGFGTENVAEGDVLEIYNGATNADRIKYDISAQTTARVWWLRSPLPGFAGNVRVVLSDGSLGNYVACDGNGAVAACEIG